MLMKSADGNSGNCCNTNEDRETARGMSDIKMQVKNKKILCAQSSNQLHCNSLGAEKKLESKMSVRHAETGWES